MFVLKKVILNKNIEVQLKCAVHTNRGRHIS